LFWLSGFLFRLLAGLILIFSRLLFPAILNICLILRISRLSSGLIIFMVFTIFLWFLLLGFVFCVPAKKE